MAKFYVDKEQCIGCGFCVDTCPEVYKFDEDEKAEAYAESNLDSAQEACDNCPVNAIERID